jgi:ATP-dependent RNA helicase RhlE
MSNSHLMPASPRSGGVFRRNKFAPKPGRQRNGAVINVERFINKAVPGAEVVAFVPQHQFMDFDFDPRLQQTVASHGYITPTPIQDQAIKAVLEGRDLIGLANTGTGKTAAFLLPIINSYLRGSQGTSLIVVPTRELASQIEDEFRAFSRGFGFRSAVIVGGASIFKQKEAIRRRPQLVIGTPGRLNDLIKNHGLKLAGCQTFVLDEADRMLDMGFIRDIRFIISQLPDNRQSLCFSATLTPEIESIIQTLLRDPVTVSVRTRETSEQVEQDIIRTVSRDHKVEVLIDILKKPESTKVLVFGDTKFGVQRLADKLEKQGIAAAAIHGNKSQPQRQRALNDFKNERVKVLVATDVAARGLDIPDVSHVINFDQPKSYDDYVHRIGRTGRAGKVGSALTFVE